MLKRLEIAGFKSFARKTVLDFSSSVTAIVGPNGSGKSNVAEAFRFALGEQSMKSMRGKRSEDLIFSGSHSAARTNRAAVAIVFDNSRRLFALDFDEVSIERAVFRDGTSEYFINGSKTRLRDVQELLARANIGESGHHIISQGEADRILLASPRDRRSTLEDALGLKVYEFKKQDAIRKLEKTEENISHVEALRRELAPHLRFLGKQVEKLEHAAQLRSALAQAACEYFSIEDIYIEKEKFRVAAAEASATEQLAVASAELSALEKHAAGDAQGMAHLRTVRAAEAALETATSTRAALSREIGRIEGALAETKKRAHAVTQDPYAKVPRADIAALHDEIERQAEDVSGEPEALAAALSAIRVAGRAFFERFAVSKDDYLADEERALHALEEEREMHTAKDAALAEEVEHARMALARAREESIAHDEAGREGQRRLIDLAQTQAHAEAEVARLSVRRAEITHLAEECELGKQDVAALAGPAVLSYAPRMDMPDEPRTVQETRRRTLERLKIRLEESGGTGEDIRREFEEVSEREQFLARELADLAQSASGLKALIADLDAELAKHFAEGLASVNQFFGEFFSLMFGGGDARLILEEPAAVRSDEDAEDSNEDAHVRAVDRPGIEVSVHLPKKRVQALMQLSGGERALTSIALIFAMSQVNPPPFLILDETDAALDEANSRRYGDMIETLAKRSQLIVITHNRETMSRANILYGVTMGGDGVSKLLSVKFDEAVAVAK
ncbi:MAG: hypothetical protein B7X04_00365 [Parcubacteria group bacterium 21-54-25]|nr:MAG: hypothetical protein B7X04_00365 [Parcubacteria group bacterium 21-54-25]HQU07489.1 AAA family ATPase [Candidatus Paceibacterota bacterium]